MAVVYIFMAVVHSHYIWVNWLNHLHNCKFLQRIVEMAALMNIAIFIVVLCCCCYCFCQGNYPISLVSMEEENFHNSAASSSIFLAIATLRSLPCWKHYAVTSLTAATNHGYSSLVYLCTMTWQSNYKTSSSYIFQESIFLERSTFIFVLIGML